jgi:hypothetical protein
MTSSNGSNRRRWSLAHPGTAIRLLLAAAGILASGAALAIPSNPDPFHTLAATPWSSVAIGVLAPGVNQHQHLDTNNLFGVAGVYKTYSVWDDHTYRYNGVANRVLTVATDARDYGHGYMQCAATFAFVTSNFPNPVPPPPTLPAPFPVWAKNIILNQVRTVWETFVNGVGVNSNGVPIETKMQFREVAMDAAPDFTIKFDVQYPDGNGGMQPFPEDQYADSYQGPGAPLPLPGGAPQGGQDRVLAFWTPAVKQLTFNANINWYQVANDLNPANGGNQFDFQSCALHEWGHVLGLDHPMGGGPPFTVMNPTLPRRGDVTGLGINQNVDGFSGVGAKDLYTIATAAAAPAPNPVPASSAPAMGLMALAIVGAGALFLRKKRVA